MSTVSVLVPFRAGCIERERAWDFVRSHYGFHFPDWELIEGSCDGEWSKGAAVRDALSRASGDVLVLADADSYLTPAQVLRDAVEMLNDERRWIVPHSWVYRLHRKATQRAYAGIEPRTSETRRDKYIGPPGGGFVVLGRDTYEEVGGIDDRYLGWGGEDVSFGWALETLIGPFVRLTGELWHLDHPHPAPKLRGSAASEALVAQYKAAIGVPRLMRALVNRTEPEPKVTLDPPAVFRSELESQVIRIGFGRVVFRSHQFETDDADIAEALRFRAGRCGLEEVPRDVVCQRH